MGVHGLSSFIKGNDELFTKYYELRDTHIVVDAFNLMNMLAQASMEGERTDLFGGDMVAFGLTLNRFFDNLESCNIKPILVMDGAQTFEDCNSKAAEKLSRSRDRFNNVLQINTEGFGHYVFPAAANIVFKSVAVDRGIKIYQGFFEADMEVARLAREYKCPALSDDSDFFLVDLPQGLIPISSLKWHKFKTARANKYKAKQSKATKSDLDMDWRKPKTPVQEETEVPREIEADSMTEDSRQVYSYILCDLYKQENFKNYIPDLNITCLPLIGPLLGNDFVSTDTHSKVIQQLPLHLNEELMKKKLHTTSNQHEKIVRVLCFFVDRTPEQVIKQLSLNLPGDERSKFKKDLKSAMDVYVPPLEDTYEAELRKIYEAGFKLTYAKRMPKPEILNAECDKAIKSLANWLISCAEKSVMTHKVLELLNKNVLFIKPAMDDVSLPSAQICRYRVYGVILRLLRPTTASKKPIQIYNRAGDAYEKTLLHQVYIMDEFGPMKYLAYDVPSLAQDTRRDLVLATFHFNHDKFVKGLLDCDMWFDPKHGDEYMTVWMIMDYIDIECKDAKLTKHFRQAVMLCLVYYFCILHPDDNFDNRMEQKNNLEFISGLQESIKARYLSDMPVIGKTLTFGTRNYECSILHQISQLHVSIDGFNLLNAFLGDPLTRIRAEYWLNSCLIYNLTEALRRGIMKVPKMPDIIACAMTPYSSQLITIEPSKPNYIHSPVKTKTKTKTKTVR